jgi:RNA polymerase sigma-70 factor, ECF subfamily
MSAAASEFDQYRQSIFGLAYRMLGSVMDAEDVVQEAFLHWQKVSTENIQSPKSYLMTIVTRLCIDQLRSARTKREEYIGDWLPEPWLQDANPDQNTDLIDSLSTAFLLVLERLTPPERAVLLLHDVFGYTYEEIGGIVGRTTADCRQIGHRAHGKLSANQPRYQPSTQQVLALTEQFVRACTEGDLTGLVAVLSDDAILRSDSDGKAKAARNPIMGAVKIARFFVAVRRKYAPASLLKVVHLNGQIAVIEYQGDEPSRVNTFEFKDDRIKTIYRIANPAKLTRLPP